MKEISVSVIGCGSVANDHLSAWRRVSQARVTTVCDLNETLAQNTARLWKIPSYCTSFSHVINSKRGNVDLIDVCTPPQSHASLAVQAMKAGFHVLLEKPMTVTVEDAEKIVQCQENTGMKACVMHNWLFEPSVVKATSIVKRGLLGEVIHVDVETLYPEDDPMIADKNHWCHRLPGGRFGEMLAHPVYLVEHFLGELETINVYVSKIGQYEWMKSDELFITFQAGKKLGNAYVSCNASRDAIFVNLYGRDAVLRLDIVNATANIMPARSRRKTSRFSKGFDSLRQASQLIEATANNIAKIAFRRWLSGHEMCIKLLAESLIDDVEVPVTVKDGYRVVKLLKEICEGIEKAEKTQI